MKFAKFITIDLETGKKILSQVEASLIRYEDGVSVKQAILNEIARAEGVEDEIKESLATEVQRAKDAEEAIRTSLKSLEDELSSEIERVVGLIDALEEKVDEHIADDVKHITSEERTKWNKVITDLATEVSSREQADQQINTELATKAVKTEVQSALDLKADKSQLGTAAALNVGKEAGNVVKVENDGKIDKSLLPSIAINETRVVNSADAAMELSIENGDVVIINPESTVAHSDDIVKGTFICVNAEADTFEERFRELYSSSDSISKGEVQQLINAETAARTAKDSEIENNLAVETSTRIQKDSELQDAISAEETRALAAEAEIAGNLSKEVTRATEAERVLDGKIDTEISNRTSEISRVEGLVSTEKSRAEGAEGKLREDLTTETSRATQAEQALSDKIDAINNTSTGILAEAKKYADLEDAKIEEALETAKTQLNQSIAGETSARTQAVQNLQGQINAVPGKIADAVRVETEAREAADQALDTRVTSLEENKVTVNERVETLEETMEIVNGEDSVEGSFRKAVKDLETVVNAKDAELEESITNMGAETLEAAKQYSDAELDKKSKELADQILEEQTQRVESVNDLTDKYTELKTDSENKDKEHKAALDVINGEGEGSIKKALVDAKAYTDTQVGAEQQRAEAAELQLTNTVNTKADKTALEAEVQRATRAEETLTQSLETEVARATAAEEVLEEKVTTLESKVDANLVTAKSYTDSEVAKEAGLRTQEDAKLQKAIEDEVAAREGLDTKLTQSIEDEVAARTAADEALDERVKVLEARDAEAVVVKYNDGGVAVGDIVKVVDGTANKATLADEFVAGIVVKVADGKASVAVMGKLTMSGLVANKTYFLGADGTMTTTMPSVVGQHIVILGRSTTTTDFLLRIEEGIEIKA